MDKKKGRYKVSWEEGGCDWCSFTDDIDEAIKYAYEKETVSDHVVSVFDTRKNKRILQLNED